MCQNENKREYGSFLSTFKSLGLSNTLGRPDSGKEMGLIPTNFYTYLGMLSLVQRGDSSILWKSDPEWQSKMGNIEKSGEV